MKSYNKKHSFLIIFTLLLIYFFVNNVNYASCYEKNSKEYLVPIGKIIQIDGELENLMVRSTPKDSPLKTGDLILEINDTSVNNFTDISDTFFSTEETYLKLKIKRKNQNKTILCSKNILKKINFNNYISGFATLTFVNPKNNTFGAIGHPISINGTKKLPLKNGSIATTSNLSIEKSFRGHVGSINAQKNYTIGEFKQNTDYGIKGTLQDYNLYNKRKYKVADLNEIRLGKAQIILQNTENNCEKYDIEILKIENQDTPSPKTFKIKITDQKLLNSTGGIAQGMSGTPIIQDDKIIGAISHALENNPQIGYGVYIKWML